MELESRESNFQQFTPNPKQFTYDLLGEECPDDIVFSFGAFFGSKTESISIEKVWCGKIKCF